MSYCSTDLISNLCVSGRFLILLRHLIHTRSWKWLITMCPGTLRTCAFKFRLYCPKYLIRGKSREHSQNLLSIEIHLDGRFVKDVWVHCLRIGIKKNCKKNFKRIFWCHFTHNENIFSQMIPFSQLYWQSFRFLHSDSCSRSFNCSSAEQIVCHSFSSSTQRLIRSTRGLKYFQDTWIKRRSMSDIKYLIFQAM